MLDPASEIRPDLVTLVRLFHASTASLGSFRAVAAGQVPSAYRRLLDHDQHMTVTLEDFHGGEVDVQVLQILNDGNRYARRILLRRQSDRTVVQYGIVRLNLQVFEPGVRAAIQSQTTPLGRILIDHVVWRQVKRHQLYEVHCGPELANHFSLPIDRVTFGRTAMIHCNGDPAVELLEIVAPVS